MTQASSNEAGDGAPLPPVRGVRSIDVALIAYARAFEHPWKIRLLKWFARGLTAGRIEVRHVGGAVVAINPDDYIGWQIFKGGHYEPASLTLARHIMAVEPGLFVDVGANFGWYTLAIAPIAGATVIGIEPDSRNCSALRANVARNALRNVTICNAAAGPAADLLAMSPRAPGNSGTAAVRSAEPACGSERYWVAAAPLQVLLERLVRPPERPVLLKIDVEGFELHALAGLDFEGPFRPKNILMECEPAFYADGAASSGDVAAFLKARGYTLHDVFGRVFGGDGPLAEANLWARDRSQAAARP